MTDIDEPHDGGRREELIAAALAGELTPEEAFELDRLRAGDPTVDRELASFGALLDDVHRLGSWEEVQPSEELRARIVEPPVEESAGRTAVPRRVRLPFAVGAAAACLALGAVGGVAAGALQDRAVDGPPGTLGAVETIAFVEGAGSDRIEVDGSVVAHTWGTETILRGEGFAVGETYELVLVTDSGERLPSGSFLGSAVEIDCEMNAAVLREAVESIEITDASGTPVATATLPEV